MGDKTPAAKLSERVKQAATKQRVQNQEETRFPNWVQDWHADVNGLVVALQAVVDRPNELSLVAEQLVRASEILHKRGLADVIPDGHESHFGPGWGFACDLLRHAAAEGGERLEGYLQSASLQTRLLDGIDWRHFRDEIVRGVVGRTVSVRAKEFPTLFPEEYRAERERARRLADGPFETSAGYGLRVDGTEFLFQSSEQQVYRIIRYMWPPQPGKEVPVGEVMKAIGSNAHPHKWASNQAAKVRPVLGRCGVMFTLEGDNRRAILFWRPV